MLNQEHSHLPTGLLKPQISLVPASPVPKLKQEWSFKNVLAFLACCSLKDERLALSCHYSKGQNFLPRVISCFIFQYLLIFHPSPFASDFLHPWQTHIPKYHSYFLTFRLFQLPGTFLFFLHVLVLGCPMSWVSVASRSRCTGNVSYQLMYASCLPGTCLLQISHIPSQNKKLLWGIPD